MRPTPLSFATKRPHGSSWGLALVLALSFAVLGCDHATDPEGPNLVDLFGIFELREPLGASTDAVDFAGGEDVTFTAEFSKQVDWVIEITGQESGAVKRLEGFSSSLTPANARWRGGTTELPFFREETVEVALSRWAELKALESEVADLGERLETRKAVEKAKGVLMKKLKITEAEAFRWIQKTAMDRRLGMREVADAVVAGMDKS